MSIRSFLSFTGCSLVAAALFAASPDHKTWSDAGGGPDNSHFTTLSQITKSNVKQLSVAWTYPSRDTVSYVWNPLIVDNVMYVLARGNSLVALDATTGKEIWVHAALTGIAPRGINYWESKDRKDRRLIFQRNSYLEEVDAQTGKSILTFGTDGMVNLRDGLLRFPGNNPFGRVQSNNPGKIFENLLILGSAPGEGFITAVGDLRAFDVITGKLVWQFHTIPRPGEYGADTLPKDGWRYIGAANTWGELTVDEKRGIAYFPTGSPTYDFYGADRKGADLFGDCLLALDARTGKRLWHFQMVHHDLWDYDNTSAPQLITLRHNGKMVDAVALAGKTGFLYVFDRVTGKPIWPIEERAVPKSDMPGEEAWPTQPYPTVPPPFAVQKFTADDINPYILKPEERAHWKQVVDSARNEGIFTPPSMRDTVSMPGNQGGSNWGTTSANPVNGMVFVLGLNEPAILKMSENLPGRGGAAGRGNAVQGRAIFEQRCQMCHGPDLKGNGSAPSLIGVVDGSGADSVRAIITGGKGPMPSFSSELNEGDIDAVVAFLSNPAAVPGGRGGRAARGGRGGAETEWPDGPVVATGGAPAAKIIATAMASMGRGAYGGMAGPPYPEGVEVPQTRYYTGYNVMGVIMKPPYTTLTAYDLNKGTIKWQVPVGDDLRAAAEGHHNTGAIGLRAGMVVTATGLVFLAGGDGKIRAYDQEDGKVLWEAALPGQSRGIPSTYEINGKQYLVVNATTATGRGGALGAPALAEESPRGYVVFALPDNTK